MKITLSDIANRVGVSKSLVSMYLNNHRLAANIAADTKRRIDRVVAETGYRPSFTARALASGRNRTLGMVVGGLNNAYFANLANAALEETAARGYQLQLSVTRWNKEEEARCLDSMLERRPDGIIYCPQLSADSPQYRMITESNYPMFILEADDPLISNIRFDVDKAFFDAIAFLKARGHRRVTAYLFSISDEAPEEPWPVAFLAACRSHGIEPDLHLLRHTDDRIVDEIMKTRSSALMFQEQNTIPRLLTELEKAGDYAPDIIAGYCPFDKFIRHPRMVGGIFSESEEMIRSAVQALIDWAENGKPREVCRMRFAAQFHPVAEISPEFTLTYAFFHTER